MPTISGLRRRGYTPASIRDFSERIGVSKVNSLTDISILESAIRDDLNTNAPRSMAVIDAVKIVIENYPEEKIELLKAPNHPQNNEMGYREIYFSKEIYIDKKDLDSLETKVPGRPHIAELMVKKNYVSNISEAFSKYLGNGKIDGIDNHQLGIKEIINLAKQSKSLVFLAHPHTLMSNKLYSKSDNWIDNKFHNYIQTLKDMDIDGIEVYYPGYSHNTINTLLEVCENQKLLVSGGSDFHGSRKPNNLLGIGYENSPIKVPYELLSKMKELHAKL